MPHCNRPNRPNTQTQPTPEGRGAVPIECPPDNQPPSSPEGLTPGRCFKDTPVRRYTPLSISVWKKFRGSSGTTLRPASQISSRPPHSPPVVAGAPQARPTVSVSPRFPPIPQSSGVHPLTRAKCCVTPSPRSRVHRIIPLYTPKPHTCSQFPFCSRAPLGARSCR